MNECHFPRKVLCRLSLVMTMVAMVGNCDDDLKWWGVCWQWWWWQNNQEASYCDEDVDSGVHCSITLLTIFTTLPAQLTFVNTFCTKTICCIFGYRLPSLHWPRLIGFLYLIIILFSFFTHFFTFEARKLYNQNSKVFSRNKQFQWYFHVDKTRCQNELRN